MCINHVSHQYVIICLLVASARVFCFLILL